MGFLSNRKELNDKNEQIISLQNKINNLEDKINNLEEEIEELKESNSQYRQKSQTLENEYINTGNDCLSCFATLSKKYKFCPNCGCKVENDIIKEVNVELNYERQYTMEEDPRGCIITHYDIAGQKK